MLSGGTRELSALSQPFVTIITVVYNSEALIEKTIQSIISQTTDDYEYIIIDGNSKDGTLDIIRRYSSNINHWQSEPDHGIYDAMNKGLSLAKGKFLLFINSGDLLDNNTVLKQLVQYETTSDIIFGETNLINAVGEVLGTRTALTTRKLPEVLNWKSFQSGMVVSHQSILVRKSICPLFDLQYRCSADVDWVIKSLKSTTRITNSHLVISKYLVGGFSAVNPKIALKERFWIFKNHYGIGTTLLIHSKIVLRALKHKLQGKINF